MKSHRHYHFVKTFPVLSKGFEIETEMSIHAVNKNMFVENVVIESKGRVLMPVFAQCRNTRRDCHVFASLESYEQGRRRE